MLEDQINIVARWLAVSGLTLRGLSVALDVSPAMLCRVRSGQRVFSYVTLQGLERRFEKLLVLQNESHIRRGHIAL